ncbi:MAG: hypothetical protein MZW92_31540 [Comamonadaceae bacterium]|nr:hypothetical protein [Comamonadaceae bacterium]
MENLQEQLVVLQEQLAAAKAAQGKQEKALRKADSTKTVEGDRLAALPWSSSNPLLPNFRSPSD